MAALRLEDIIIEQRKLLARGDERAQATIDRLESIAKTVAESEKVHKQDRVLQVAQTLEAVKADKDDDRIVQAVEKGLIEKTGDGLNANVAELLKTIKGWYTSGQQPESQSAPIPQTQDGARAEQARQILEERSKEQAARFYPTFNEKIEYRAPEKGSGIQGMFKSLVDMFKGGIKLENLIDMKAPPSGLFGTEIRTKVEKEQYIKDRLATEKGRMLNLPIYQGPEGEMKAKATFSRQYDEQRTTRRNISATEKEIARLRSVGMSDSDIARTDLFNQRETADRALQASDPQYRAQRKLDGTLLGPQVPTSRQKTKATPLAPPLMTGDSGSMMGSTEERAEANRELKDQTSLLRQIELNTRPGAPSTGAPQAVDSVSQSGGGGFGLSDLIGLGSRGVRGAGKVIRSVGSKVLGGIVSAGGAIARGVSSTTPIFAEAASKSGGVLSTAAEVGEGAIAKATPVAAKTGGILGKAGGLAKGLIGKAALPLAAGMALYDGVTGYNKATENLGIEGREATVGEKLSSAGGSILSGLSFGLLDEKSATKGIASLFGAGPDKTPGGSIMPNSTGGLPTGGKPVAIPATGITAPSPRTADAVYGRSGENAAAKTATNSSQAPVVVSAPQSTNIQQTQNYLGPNSARNTESSWREYNKSRYAF